MSYPEIKENSVLKSKDLKLEYTSRLPQSLSTLTLPVSEILNALNVKTNIRDIKSDPNYAKLSFYEQLLLIIHYFEHRKFGIFQDLVSITNAQNSDEVARKIRSSTVFLYSEIKAELIECEKNMKIHNELLDASQNTKTNIRAEKEKRKFALDYAYKSLVCFGLAQGIN